jgi:predicted SAM-dependent methyltransferase
MKLLNVGCGGDRPGLPWMNLDTLKAQLAVGTPERANLDQEDNYIECDLSKQSIPPYNEHYDGVLLQHVLEHFTCHDAVEVLLKCKAVLKPGGLLCASVPDADYFMSAHHSDTRENAVELFGEPISEPEHDTFFSYALFHKQHQQILSKTGLVALLARSGFKHIVSGFTGSSVYDAIEKQLNRKKFSAILWADK